MPAQIYLSVKNGKLADVTESQVHKKVEEFHDRHRRLRVFQVVIEPEIDGAPRASIRAWRNTDVEPAEFATTRPDVKAEGTGESVLAATDAATEDLAQQLKRDPVAVKSQTAAWYQSPLVWAGVLLVVAVGIGVFLLMQPRSRRDLSPVNGTVTLDNVPLADAQVVFHPVRGGRPAVATTDKNGKFSVSAGYHETTGAYHGNYKVTIVLRIPAAEAADPTKNLTKLIDQEAESRIEGEEAEARGETIELPKSKVHVNYTNFVLTPLKITVPSDGPADFKLTPDGK